MCNLRFTDGYGRGKRKISDFFNLKSKFYAPKVKFKNMSKYTYRQFVIHKA